MTRAIQRIRPSRKAPTELGDQRRLALLDAAYSLIAEKGLEGLRTRDIAARARVNISTLHYYFGTKEALLVALVDYVRDKFTAPLPSVQGNAKPTMRSHLEGAWQSFQQNPHLATVLQELVTRGHRDASARAAFRTLHNFWNKVVEEVLSTGVEQGTLRGDLDPRLGARIITSFIIGAMVQLGVNAKAFDFAAVTKELERWAANRGDHQT
jgi:AcrR family transcriptional regulator